MYLRNTFLLKCNLLYIFSLVELHEEMRGKCGQEDNTMKLCGVRKK